MGSQGPKPRKKSRHLKKVAKYEEPNTAPLAGLANEQGPNPGRFGHSADGQATKQPGKFGAFVIRLLGKKPGDHI
jgi:hypothetical protein